MTTEFMLLVECCRWAFAEDDPSPIQRLARDVQWDRVIALSRRHRVQGLVGFSLRTLGETLPGDIANSLAGDSATVAQTNLRAARACARLLDHFTKAAIPILFIKGLTLGKLAYGDPFLKMSWDIDVLVPEDAVGEAAAELRRLDYRLIMPSAANHAPHLTDWHRRRKESVWLSPDGLHLELHSRLADNPKLIPGIGFQSPTQAVEIASGIVLPTLARDELFAYLCVHGASSSWFRLKWITDLAALIHRCSPTEIDALYDRCREYGAGRASAQALLLAEQMYGTALNAPLERQLMREAANRLLLRTAWAQTLREKEPTEIPLGTASIHLSQLLLLPGWRFKLNEACRQLADWTIPGR